MKVKNNLKNIFMNQKYYYNMFQILGFAIFIMGLVTLALTGSMIFFPKIVQPLKIMFSNSIAYILIGIILLIIGKMNKE